MTTLGEFYETQTGSAGGFCRHAPTLIFKTDQVEVYGASECHVNTESVKAMDLVVNLTGRRMFQGGGRLISGPKQWAFLRRFTDRPAVTELVLDWKDMKAFPVGREFWLAFYDGLKRQGVKRLLLFCAGGHGRTGSAAGCLMTVAKEIHGGQAIRFIREHYCERAIETKTQEDYVRSMTKRIDNK
jgi:hypothetical protein